MKRLGTTLLLILLALPAWATRHALLIGNWDYDENGLFQPLRQPKNDLAAMQKLLKEKGRGFRITVIKNARRSELMRRFNRFLESLHKGDTVLFYYSGHGAQIGNSDYLIPVGAPFYSIAEVIDRDQGAVSLNIMVERIQEKIGDEGVQIAVLDACRNDLTKGGGGAGAGLGSISAAGVLVAYAASPGKRAWATGPNGMSPFTYYLVEALKQNASKKIQEVLEETAKAVRHYTRKYQWPWQAGNLMGEFCLAPPCGRGETRLVNAGKTTRAKSQAREPAPSSKRYAFHDTLKDGSPGPEMMYLPPMTFRMGDLSGAGQRNEKPVRTVHLDGYAIGRYEVTNAQYVAFLNAVQPSDNARKRWLYIKAQNESSHIWQSGDRFGVEAGYEKHPVVGVSWYGVQAYVHWLSEQTGQRYRLPTEAEWEAAARAGTQTKYSWGNQEPICTPGAPNGAQFGSCNKRRTALVGTFAANPFGLYDMHGNVREWVADCYLETYDPTATHNPLAENNHCVLRVVRDGAWSDPVWLLRSARRQGNYPNLTASVIGFRVARDL